MPPSDDGGDQDTVIDSLPAVALTFRGADGALGWSSKAPASQSLPAMPGLGSPRSSVVIVHEVVGTSSNAELAVPIASVSGPFEPFAASAVASPIEELPVLLCEPRLQDLSDSTLYPASVTVAPASIVHPSLFKMDVEMVNVPASSMPAPLGAVLPDRVSSARVEVPPL